MYEIDAELILYDNIGELEFLTNHPYWLSVNGYYIKLTKKECNDLKLMYQLRINLKDDYEY